MAGESLSTLTIVLTSAVVCTGVVASGVVTYQHGGRYGERFAPDEAHLRRVYEPRTHDLRVIEFDRNRNGRVDSWSYYERGRMVRTEADDDEDGLIDHWFYYDDHDNVVKMGLSTKNDGVCDAWWYDGPQSGMHRVEYADRRSGSIVRVEYFADGRMIRSESRLQH